MKAVKATPTQPNVQSKQTASEEFTNSKQRKKDDSIAIIGLGCWYPGASNLREFWENIVARRREFRQFIAERLPLDDYYDADPQTPDKIYASNAAYIDGFDFNWSKWRIPKRTFESTDIAQWLALDIAAKAIEDAGYSKNSLPRERTGVIVGNTLTGEQSRAFNMRLRWPYVLRSLQKAAGQQDIPTQVAEALAQTMEDIYKSSFPEVNEDSLQGGLSNTIAGRICNYFDLHGGGYTVDGACSSSLLSVCTASNYLANGEWDTAIAGGVDISLDTFELIGFAKTSALSPDDMFVYDKRARGFLPGEGCGFIMLKRLADARRDGDKVYAVIHGWGVSSDGKGGITAPNSDGQSTALKRAYEKAEYSPHELHFIEGHGTGTPRGDKTELQGVAKTMDYYGGTAKRQCGMTSLKSIVGHTKAAAGIGALIKTTIAVNRRVIPPTAGCATPNAVFENEALCLYPVISGEKLSSNETIRAGVSAMGFGGINSHITIESADLPYDHLAPGVDETALLVSNQQTEVFPLSATSIESLRERLPELAQTAQQISLGDMVDFAADLAAATDSSACSRAVVVAHDPQDLANKLRELHQHLSNNTIAQGQYINLHHSDIILGSGKLPNRIGFLLPGQGSQQLNMGRVLVGRYRWAQELVSRVDEILRQHLGRDLSSAMFRDPERASDQQQLKQWEAELTQTDIAQPAICLTSLLYTTYLKKLGIKPVVLGGHSLGEITALHLSGAISEQDFFEIAVKRGMAMKNSASANQNGAMAALACNEDQAQKILQQVDGYLTIANINSPKQIVVSGDADAIDEAVRIAKANDTRATALKVSSAFHSDYMSSAADKLKQVTANIEMQPYVETPVISGVTARQLNTDVALNDYLANQCVNPVNFIGLAKQLSSMCDWAIEVGPGKVLSNLNADIFQGQDFSCNPIASTPTQDADLNRVIGKAFVTGHAINWPQLYEQRLVRPFVAKSNRTFIPNPCENLAVVDFKKDSKDRSVKSTNNGGLVVGSLSSEFDSVQINSYLQHRKQFIVDVIKADMRTIPQGFISDKLDGETKKDSTDSLWADEPTVVEIPGVDTTSTNTSDRVAQVPIPAENKVLEALSQLVAERTGYPMDSFDQQARLLDDLNLDSIKAGEVIAELAKQFHVSGQIEPAQLSNATLLEISKNIISQLSESLATDSNTPAQYQAQKESVPDSEIRQILVKLVADISGYSVEHINLSDRLLDDLNLDSIKAAEFVAQAAKSLNVAGQIEPAQFSNATLQEVAQSISGLLNGDVTADGNTQPRPEPDSNATIQEILLNLVADISGYSVEHINLSDRLLDDLNLDSIKAAEFIAQAAKSLNIAGQIEPASLANATIEEVASVMEQHRLPSQKQQSQSDKQQPPKPESPKHQWVRNFKIQLQSQALEQTVDAVEDWAAKSVIILTSGQETTAAVELASSLTKMGAQVNSLYLDDANAELSFIQRPDHIIGIFPPFAQPGLLTQQTFSYTVRELQRFVQIITKQKPHRLSFLNYQPSEVENLPESQTYTGAFARSIALENPQLNVSVVNLSSHIAVHDAAMIIVQELSQMCDSFKEVFYEHANSRLVPQASLLNSGFAKSRPISWSAQDVIVVTGGGKGITAECALALAHTGAKFALVGSSPFNANNPTPATAEIGNTLQRFRSEGLQAKYYACDVTDESAVNQLINRINIELGQVTGVIHGAGSNTPARVERVELSQAFKETAPKVLGAINLIQALVSAPPKMFVSLTSIIGVAGMEGNAWYAFANDTLDKIMGQLSQLSAKTEVLSVAFSVWGEIGMGRRLGVVERLGHKGIGAISTQEGIERFAELFKGNPDARQVIVTASLGGLSTWRDLTTAPQSQSAQLKRKQGTQEQGRFAQQIEALEPGVTLTVRTRLSLEQDPYLADHDYRGSLLFPTVFGMEAMAQVTATLLDCDIYTICRFEEINLERPIVVDPKRGQEIEIFALAEDTVEGESEKRVHVAIRCESTGYSKDHFAAIVVAGKRADAPKCEPLMSRTKLQVEPKTVLYGDLLFQGPLFQNIDAVYSLDDKSVFLSARQNGSHLNYQYSLHNPFIADNLLQSIQFPVAPHIYLPIKIEKWELFDTASSGLTTSRADRQFITADAESIDDSTYRSNVTSQMEDGTVIEQITGYWVKKVEDREALPNAVELASFWTAGINIDLAQLREAFHIRGKSLPVITLMHTPGIHSLHRHERHEIEKPIVSKSLREYYGKNINEPLNFELTWLSNGKPELIHTPTDLGISISHDYNYCLCVVGEPDQGCDIVPVLYRSASDWHALLGPRLIEVFKDLVARGLDSDSAGTSIMAAYEAAQKISGESKLELKLSPVEDKLVSFKVEHAGVHYFVNTIKVNIVNNENKQHIIAIAGREARESVNSQHPVIHSDIDLLKSKASSDQFHFDEALRRPVFEYMFRTTFKEAARLDRRVIFSSYLSWKGKLRELSMMEIGAKLAEHIATGEWGLVTNSTNLTIYGEAQCYDLVKGRFWIDEVVDSTIKLKTEFQRLNQDNLWSTIAIVEQDTTWVKIIGHGKVIPAPLPDYYVDFLNKVYANEGSISIEQLPQYTYLNPGDEVVTSNKPPQARINLHQEVFSTTLEDSNLVGNLYYANYFSWQGRVMDFFLHKLSPEYFMGVGEYGEWSCINSRMDYLRDAMPFDRIQVRMSIKKLFRKGAVFEFLYYRQLEDGSAEKLAVGQQTVAWVKRTEDGKPLEYALPKALRVALLNSFEDLSRAIPL